LLGIAGNRSEHRDRTGNRAVRAPSAAAESALDVRARIDGYAAAAFVCRNIKVTHLAAVRGWPEIGAARNVRANLARGLVGERFGTLRIGLHIFGRIVFDRLAGLGVNAFRPSHLLDVLRGLVELPIEAI